MKILPDYMTGKRQVGKYQKYLNIVMVIACSILLIYLALGISAAFTGFYDFFQRYTGWVGMQLAFIVFWETYWYAIAPSAVIVVAALIYRIVINVKRWKAKKA